MTEHRFETLVRILDFICEEFSQNLSKQNQHPLPFQPDVVKILL